MASQMASRALTWTKREDGISVQSLTRACNSFLLMNIQWFSQLLEFLMKICDWQ